MKILWAVDPFQTDLECAKAMSQAIDAIGARLSCEIEPVYVSSDPGERVPPRLRIQYTKNIRERAAEAFGSPFKTPSVLPLRAIGPVLTSSQMDHVNALLDYARWADAEMIVVGTHARKGLARWVMGSFAETLSLTSDVPLLLINPACTTDEGIKKSFDQILFSTDLSEESRVAFRRLVPVARAMKSRITLFHQFRFGLTPSLDLAAIASAIPADEQKAEIQKARETLKQWADEARSTDVQVEESLDLSSTRTVAAAILNKSENSPGIIALAAESNAIEVRLLGSTSRQVIREAKFPVWLLHCPPVTKLS